MNKTQTKERLDFAWQSGCYALALTGAAVFACARTLLLNGYL